MGGCCCCCSKSAEINSAPPYYYHPRTSEVRVPLSSGHGATSAQSTGLLVDTNLETSVPDAYRPPRDSILLEVALGHPQTPPRVPEIRNDKGVGMQTTNSDSVLETAGGNAREMSAKGEDLKESYCKIVTNFDHESENKAETELSKSIEPVISVTEECPTCLEEYDAENPKITTKCEHHFHLACILEWMERSDTCPVCDKEMIFSPPIDQ